MAYTVKINDPKNLIDSNTERELELAAFFTIELVASYIEWQGVMDLEVKIDDHTMSPYPNVDGILPSIVSISYENGEWRNLTLREALTGVDWDPDSPDVGCTIYLSSDGTIRNYGFPVWIDPAPSRESAPSIPEGHHDFIGILTHEIFHGLAFFDITSEWKNLVSIESGISHFIGEKTVRLLNSKLPFTDTVTHYGHMDATSSPIQRGLMYYSGNYQYNRFDIGRVDLAILEDLGYSIKSYDGLPLTELDDQDPNVTGDDSDNTIYGNYQANILRGMGGNDLIEGGDGHDSIYGGQGSDTLDGGQGNDLLNGNEGADTLIGGRGDDTYILDSVGDEVIEIESDGGIDSIVSYLLETLIPDFVENITLAEEGISVSATGNSLDNVIIGNARDNLLSGRLGDDQIFGGNGKDELFGGKGNDVLNGGLANDRLYGGSGSNSLIGGDGIDRAIFSNDKQYYRLSADSDQITIVTNENLIPNSTGSIETNTLVGIERVLFSDVNLAFDLDGHAGIAARVLGAFLGADGVNRADLVGYLLDVLDNGISQDDLLQTAVDTVFGIEPSGADIVNHFHTALTGMAAPEDVVSHWGALIDSGELSPLEVSRMVVNLDLNETNIDLIGLSQTGIEYILV